MHSKKELSLGQYLARLRTTRGMTLRGVEEATNRVVSNGYLSLLEHGRIKRPSPNILYSLARVYKASYECLMTKAGYAAKSGGRPAATFAIGVDLTQDEEEELLEYLAFIRSRKAKG